VEAAPDVFKLDENEQAVVLIENPGPELQAKVARAARICPKQAIKLVD
jgi:ferredoxin